MPKINSYINPCSKGFKTAAKNDFKTLTKCQKALTITLTIFTGLATCFLFGIGGFATFKALVDHFKAKKLKRGEDPTADKVTDLATQQHFKKMEVKEHLGIFVSPRLLFNREARAKANTGLDEVKEYCKDHEHELFSKLLELGIPEKEIQQYEITVTSNIDAKTAYSEDIFKDILSLKIKVPYRHIAGSFERNLLRPPTDIRYINGQRVDIEEPEHVYYETYNLHKLDTETPTTEERFKDLLVKLETFPIWRKSAESIVAYTKENAFDKFLLESKTWKHFNKYVPGWKPNFQKNRIYLQVHKDNDGQFQVSYQLTICFISGPYNYCHSHGLWSPKVVVNLGQKIDLFSEEIREQFMKIFQDELDENQAQYYHPGFFFFKPKPSTTAIACDFQALEELLELDKDALTSLDNDKKYEELQKALKQKGTKALLKCHPDRIGFTGFSEEACNEKTKELLKALEIAKNYVASKIK